MNWDRRIGYWIKKKTIDIYVADLLFAFNSSNWKSMGTMWLFTFPPQQTPNWAEYIHRNIIRRSWYWPLQTFIWCPMFNVHLFQDGDQRLVVILNEAKIGDYSFSRFHKSVEYIFFFVVYHWVSFPLTQDLSSDGFIFVNWLPHKLFRFMVANVSSGE